MIFGFEELTIVLLFVFAFFILAAYALLKLVTKIIVISILSMAFPAALGYLGLYNGLTLNNMLIFGILGSFLYITYIFVDKLLSAVWPFFESKKEKPGKGRKQHRKKPRMDDEVEISE
ncbi:MAG: hypothetical protein HY516_04800 [Candidatus Aenigmarchaeota archaeon]|nr:hypothetical protein [Candidatus Aenigmarchaeota archaeon]